MLFPDLNDNFHLKDVESHYMCTFILQVYRVLKVLEKPYSDVFELEPLDGLDANEQPVAYERKPPAWAQSICIT